MAPSTLPPVVVGSMVKLRRRDPRGTILIVDAPDGSEFRLPVARGTYELWVPQVGTWRFRWQTEEEVRSIQVIEEQDADDEEVDDVGVVDTRSLPPLTLARRPRY